MQKKNVLILFKHFFPKKIELSSDEKVIWAHAVSVGEVVAIAPILKELNDTKNGITIILSTVTETGFIIAQKLVPFAIHVTFLFDFVFCVKRLLQNIRPLLVLVSEGDLWPVFLHEMKIRGAFVALVNGKMSDRTYARFQRFSLWAKWLYSYVDLFCVQDERMKQRFAQLSTKSKNIFVTGNTKTDIAITFLSEEEHIHLRNRIGLTPFDRCIILGSTHPSEESMLLEVLLPLVKGEKSIKVIIVPRHPERCQKVADELQNNFTSLHVSLLSVPCKSWDVLVVDTLGVLTQLYQIAQVAIVCGSFVKSVGGHNIVEPASYGLPTIVGPYMHAQRGLFESAVEQNAVMQVQKESLTAVLQVFLSNEEEREEYARKAIEWAVSLRGAAKKTVQTLFLAVQTISAP